MEEEAPDREDGELSNEEDVDDMEEAESEGEESEGEVMLVEKPKDLRQLLNRDTSESWFLCWACVVFCQCDAGWCWVCVVSRQLDCWVCVVFCQCGVGWCWVCVLLSARCGVVLDMCCVLSA